MRLIICLIASAFSFFSAFGQVASDTIGTNEDQMANLNASEICNSTSISFCKVVEAPVGNLTYDKGTDLKQELPHVPDSKPTLTGRIFFPTVRP